MIRIERAVPADTDEILKLMEEAVLGLQDPAWYVTDGAEYVKSHMEEQGFILKAVSGQQIQGFLSVHIPGQEEEHLGDYLRLNGAEKNLCAYMDSVAVRAKARGQGLMGALLEAAQERLWKEGYRFLLGTVHPQNRFSHENFRKQGYQDIAAAEKYGGLPRVIVCKELR